MKETGKEIFAFFQNVNAFDNRVAPEDPAAMYFDFPLTSFTYIKLQVLVKLVFAPKMQNVF